MHDYWAPSPDFPSLDSLSANLPNPPYGTNTKWPAYFQTMWLDRHLASFLEITVICRPFCAWSISRSDFSLPMKKRFHGPSMEGNSGEDLQCDEIKRLHRRLLPPKHKYCSSFTRLHWIHVWNSRKNRTGV